MKTEYICPHCGSKEVEVKAWVELNSNPIQYDPIDSSEEEFYYCNECCQHGIPIEQECEDTFPVSLYLLTGREAIQAFSQGVIENFIKDDWEGVEVDIIWNTDEPTWDILRRKFKTQAEADAYVWALSDFYADVDDNYYILTQEEAEEIWSMQQ